MEFLRELEKSSVKWPKQFFLKFFNDTIYLLENFLETTTQGKKQNIVNNFKFKDFNHLKQTNIRIFKTCIFLVKYYLTPTRLDTTTTTEKSITALKERKLNDLELYLLRELEKSPIEWLRPLLVKSFEHSIDLLENN